MEFLNGSHDCDYTPTERTNCNFSMCDEEIFEDGLCVQHYTEKTELEKELGECLANINWLSIFKDEESKERVQDELIIKEAIELELKEY